MPTIVQTFHGKVTGLWGTAHMRGADGKMHLLKLGDLVEKGDVILTTQNGIVQLDADATGPLPTSVAKATAGNAGVPDEIDRVISALNDPSAQDATAAGVSGGDGAGDLAPGLRVNRISEGISPAGLPSSGADDGVAQRPVATGAAVIPNDIVQAPALGADSNVIDASEEGAAVGLGLTAPTNASSAAVITVTQVPVIGQLQKADGTVVAAGSVISASDLVGLKYVPPADYNGSAPVGEFSYTVTDAGHAASGTVGIVLAAVNDAPVATADAASGLEDTPITGNVLSNDSDVDGPALQVTQYTIAGVVHAAGTTTALVGIGNIAVNADGSYTFTPAADYNGPVPVIGYTVSDGSLTSSSTLTLSVTAVNDAPTAASDLASTPINVAVTIPVLANDQDRDGDTLTVTTATLANPAQGSVTINPDGSLGFTPATNYTGTATITYTVSDGHGGTDTATVTVNVGSNTPPTGADSTHTLAEDGSYTVATSDFGFADADAGQTLANVRIDSLPAAGTLLLNGVAVAAGVVVSAVEIAAGHLVFVPAADGNGAPYASFAFSVQDSAGGYDTTSNTLTLNVTPVNDAPVALNDTGSGLEDTAQTGNVLSNDSDVDGNTLSVTQFVVGGTTYAAGATATLAGVGTLSIDADGSYLFTPAADYNGPVPVATYTMTDGSVTQDATLTLAVSAVNDAPVAADDLASTPINTPLVVSVLANDTDADGDTLSVSNAVLTNPALGSVVVNADGTLGFTPANNVSGPVTISYTVSDGHGGSAIATVTVNVGSNTPPTGVDSAHALAEDGSYTVAVTDFGFADADAGQSLANVRIDTLPAAGTLLLNGVAVAAGAVVSAADIAAGHLVFVPVADGNGAPYASFTFSVQDNAGAFDTAPNTLTFNVAPQPDAAVITGTTAGATVEDTSLVASGKLDVTDPDAGEAAFVVQSGIAGAHGTFGIDAAGHWTYTLNNADPAVQALGAGQTLPSEVFAVKSVDGTTVNVTVSITGTDDAPVISTGAGAVTENTTPSTSGTLTASDVDNPALAFVPATLSGSYGSLVLQASGQWTYTLDARAEPLAQGQTVSEPITVTLTDGSTTTVTITVTGTNDAAVITPAVANLAETDAVLTTGGTLAISDVDNPATFVAQTNVAGSKGYGHFTLAANGAWTYATDTAHNEFVAGTTYTDKLTVTSVDGTISSITVNILGTNDAAVITPAVVNLTETNLALTTGGTLAIADVDSPATFVAQTNVAGSGGYGRFTVNTDGTWTYAANTAHNEFAAGTTYTDKITVTSADGTTSTITVNILGTNDAAVITPAVVNLTETNAALSAGGTLAISDADSPATFVAQSNVAGSNGYGHFTLGTNGVWTYNADTAHNEFVAGTTYTDKLNVTAADGTTSTITVNILGTNDAPVNTIAALSTGEDTPLKLSGLAINDADAGAGAMTVTLRVASGAIAAASGGGVTVVSGSGTATLVLKGSQADLNAYLASGSSQPVFTPAANASGTVALTMTTSDSGNSGTGAALTDVDTVNITVTSVNDAPVNTIVALSTNEDTALRLSGLKIADVDASTGPMTITLNVASGSLAAAGTANVVVAGSGTGTVTLTGTLANLNTYLAAAASQPVFTPAANANGTVALTMTTNDNGNTGSGGAKTDVDTVNITVNAVNDAPVNTIAALSTNEDTALKLSGLAVNDVDASTGAMTVTLKVASGLLSAAASGGVTVTGSGTATVVLTGTQADLNAYLAATASQPVYTPVANASGTVALTMTTNDNGNTGSGGAKTDVDTVTITVNAVNDAPVNTIAALSTNEDTALKLSGLKIADVDASTGSMTITLNVASGSLAAAGTANVVVAGSGTGTVTLTGTLANLNTYLAAAASQPVFTPAANANGTVALTMTTNDNGNTGSGGAKTDADTVNITVNAVNDAPVNTIAALSTNEDTALKLSGLAVNDVDASTGAMTVTLKVASGLLSAAASSGVKVAGSGTTTVVLTGTQADLNAYLAATASQPVFTPVANASGTVALTMTTNDNGNTGSGGAKTDVDSVNITVNAVNDAPVNTAPATTQATNEDTSKVITGVSVADIDSTALTTTLTAAHGTLTVVTGSGATIGANGSATVTISGTAAQINAALASITYKPTADFNGTDTLTVATSDGTTTTNAAVAIAVSAVPDIVADVVAGTEDVAVTFNPITGANEVSGADNFENAARTLTAVGTPAHGSVTFAADGSITYTPNANYSGSDSFTYTVTSGGVTETATITINLTPVNDATAPTLTVTPVARWTFDESSGTTTNDAYNAQSGTLSDSVTTPTTVLPTWTTGHNGTSGTALHFDGNGSYVALSATTTAPLMGTSSLTFWIKTTQTGNYDGWDSPAVIASEQAGGTNDIQWGVLNASGKIGFDVGNAAGIYSTTSVNDNTWHQVAITRDAATSLVSIYVDGVLEATGSPTDAGFTATLNKLTGFGANNAFSNDASSTDATDYRFLNADLDDVRIYNHVLTADQVAAIKSVESGYSDTAVANDGDAIKLSLAADHYTSLSVHGLNAGMVISDGAGHTTTIGASGTDTVVDLTGWNLTSLSVSGSGNGSSTLVFDAVDAVAGESHSTTQYLNIVNGTSLLSGGTGNDTLNGTSGADLIVGNAGNDTLNGGAGNDRILGGDGNDTINGGTGNDIIYGGAGNDVMTGGTGADTFAWHLADRGTAGAPAADAITDFNVAPVASGGDTLDLRDLLVGANHVGTDPGNLEKYLDFDTTSTPGSTVIHVSSTGGYAGGNYTAATTDETITLQGVDLRSALGLGTAATDSQIITELLTRNKLVTDGA
jgi:VCBS repeat-containing protein